MNVQGFSPVQAGTATIAATASSVNAAITVGIGCQEVIVQNAGPNIAFFRMGDAAQTAVATDFPLLVNAVYLLTKGTASNFAAIAPAGTATVYVTAGEGN